MAKRLLALLDTPDADAVKLALIIELDPLLSTQILRWANSAYYALATPLTSVREAIVRTLGYEQAASLALGLATLAPLRIPDQGVLGKNAVWRHGLWCSRLMLELRGALPAEQRPSAGAIHLTGLTQNIGYLLLSHLLPAQFHFLTRLVRRNPTLSLISSERFALGVDHTQLGHWLLEAWDMPDALRTAVRYHHSPFYDGEHQTLVRLNCLADALISRTASRLGPEASAKQIADCIEQLQIDPDTCWSALERISNLNAFN
jgi:HD-like signal output (HDOD) protein